MDGKTTNKKKDTSISKTLEGDLSTWIRAILTALLLALVVWWLAIVGSHLSDVPKVNGKGDVILDEFQRSKDILLVVLPLLTTGLGYWFGSAGKEKAEQKADEASTAAATAGERLTAVLASSTETDLIEKARRAYPEAFPTPTEEVK